MCSALAYVCFGPKADIPSVWTYRPDVASKVFYKRIRIDPYLPVSFCGLVKRALITPSAFLPGG